MWPIRMYLALSMRGSFQFATNSLKCFSIFPRLLRLTMARSAWRVMRAGTSAEACGVAFLPIQNKPPNVAKARLFWYMCLSGSYGPIRGRSSLGVVQEM
jgi:hypothetical protein